MDPSTFLFHWTEGTESGMDNSPRWDWAGGMHSTGITMMKGVVDFGVYFAKDCEALAQIWRILGETTNYHHWSTLSRNVSQAVHDHLWDAQRGGYSDLLPNGTFARIVSVSNFLPLLLEDIFESRVDTLVKGLKELSEGLLWPLASFGPKDASTYSTDMWRGEWAIVFLDSKLHNNQIITLMQVLCGSTQTI